MFLEILEPTRNRRQWSSTILYNVQISSINSITWGFEHVQTHSNAERAEQKCSLQMDWRNMPTCLEDSYTQGRTQIVLWDTLTSLEIRTSASEQSLLDH